MKPLGELCRIELGATPARQNTAMWDPGRTTENVWLSIADLPQGVHAVVSDSKEYVSDLAATRLRLIPKGTLLVSFKLTLGRLAYTGRDLFSNEAIASLLDIDASQISNEFLYWALTAFDWDKAAEGDHKIKGRTLNKAKLKAMPIPLPPLEEQQRIVAVLDEAFEGLARVRTHAEANLQNARELFEVERDRAVSAAGPDWEHTTVGDLCTKFEYGTSAKSKATGGVAVLRMGNIQDGEVDTSDLVFTDDATDIDKLRLMPGDVLFNRTNSAEHVGKAAIYRGGEPAIFAGYLIRLHRDPTRVDADYINLFLNSRIAREYGRTVMGRSVNQANISATKLRTYPISLPPLSQQRSTACRLLELRSRALELQNIYELKCRDIDDLRQSLLQKAFAGELT